MVGGRPLMFRCEAVYRGCRAVLGAQSSSTLTLLVEHLTNQSNPQHPIDGNHITKLRIERCQLHCDDERLQVTPIRKDEGFESDSESSSSTCDETFCGNQDIKVISDHVLRLDHLIHHDSTTTTASFPSSSSSTSDDTSSSATSSGNESEDDCTPRTTSSGHETPLQNGHTQVEARGSSTSTVSKTSSASGGIGDTFLMSDILYCHVAPATPRVVVVVVKGVGSSQIYAHVFQCVTEEAARALYSHYKEASNKYKLNRYRNSKRKSDQSSSENSLSTSATVCKIGSTNSHKDVGKPPSGLSSSLSKASGSSSRLAESHGIVGGRGSLRSIDTRLLKTAEKRNNDIGSNINVIEIKESPQLENKIAKDEAKPWSLIQHTDVNGVTHIEIESGPCSLISSSSETSDFNSLISLNSQPSSQLKMNSLTTIPTNTSTSAITHSIDAVKNEGSNSCPTSLITTEREILVSGDIDRKPRQRQPPQLLRGRKLSPKEPTRKFEDKKSDDKIKKNENPRRDDNRREEKKNKEDVRRDTREGRSRRGRHEVDLRNNNMNREVSILAQNGGGGGVEGLIPRIPQERQSRPREQSRTRLRHPHNKGPAPPPPPRRHPSNPSLLLVPTKSGAENARAFYPKESHIIRGNKIVCVEHPGYLNGWMHHDANNNPHHYNYYSHGNAWVGAHEYHAVRPREPTISNEMRRRSRSKSPARRPMAHRYIDAMSTFNLSQKLKDISEAVFTNRKNNMGGNTGISGNQSLIGVSSTTASSREGKGHSRSMSSVSASAVESCDGTLKSVIKKGRKVEASPQTRRVTFSAYATVQVMES